MKSYRDLDVYRQSFELAVQVDEASKTLPRHELYEVGSQIRRSAKSIPANLAEGWGRRRYKKEYIRFIVFALSSCHETEVHLDMLFRTHSLPEPDYQHLAKEYDILGKRLNRFLQGVIRNHREPTD